MLALALAAGACSDSPPAGSHTPHSALRVVTTVPVLAFLVSEVGGDRFVASSLLPPGASPHTFEPSVGDVRRASRAALFVSAGAGLDDWAQSPAREARTRLVIGELAGLRPIRGDHGNDPHVWLDPLRVRDVIVPALAEALARADPAAAGIYRQRARDFAARLVSLDEDIRALLAGARGRGYVAYHNAWRYFAQRYGLRELGVVAEAAGEDPSPRDLAELTRRAAQAGVAAVLVEPQLDVRSARTLASEFGARTVVVDPLGEPRDPERDDYESLMRFNARAFALALGSVHKEARRP